VPSAAIGALEIRPSNSALTINELSPSATEKKDKVIVNVTTFFFFKILKHTNGSSQWHDYMSLSQHMAHAP
jgi:hypothetical protein